MYFLEGKEPLTELMFLILKVWGVSPKDVQKIKRNKRATIGMEAPMEEQATF